MIMREILVDPFSISLSICFNYRFLKKEVPGRGCLGYLCCCCFRAPQAVVTVHLDGAQDLEKQDLIGAGVCVCVCVLVCVGLCV